MRMRRNGSRWRNIALLPELNAPVASRETLHQSSDIAITPSSYKEQAVALFQRAADQINKWASEDASRRVLWIPVAIGVGAGVYFFLKTEPPVWIGPSFLSLTVLLLLKTKLHRTVLQGILCFAIGFCAADFRTDYVSAPILERELTPRLITGKLISVGEGASSRRLIIDVQSINRVDAEKLPARIRINWRGREFNAKPGDLVQLRAGLSPPPPPVAPGAFDFARHLYFQRIGAVGYAVSPPRTLTAGPRSFRERAQDLIENLRFTLSRRITRIAPGEGGAIVAAVVTGKREAITERAENALRDSGLAHLLAISGLHMGLATGLIFFTLRAVLACIPTIALKFPIKKWAAAAALISGFLYLLLSGGGWSARRAFIMTAVIFIAVLLDRRALSLRNVAVAASLILITTPEALMHPGFQMSFAAVTALIAVYEWASGRQDPNRSYSLPARIKRYGIGIAATDTIAAIATAPFGLYHFNRVAIYSLPANIAAMPLMAFWIMPFAVIGLLLAPFGLDAWAWRASAFGVEMVLSAASYVSSRPGAISLTPQWPLSALVVLTIGGLWLCLQTAPWRLAGAAALPIAFALILAIRSPDIFVARSGENVAFVIDVEGGKKLAVFDKRKNRFEINAWREYLGFSEKSDVVGMHDHGRCDSAGCVLAVTDRLIGVVSRRPEGFAEDCARADIFIALYPLPQNLMETASCKGIVIDRRHVWRNGAYTIYIEKTYNLHIKSVHEARGRRPWTVIE